MVSSKFSQHALELPSSRIHLGPCLTVLFGHRQDPPSKAPKICYALPPKHQPRLQGLNR
jgi:hypothetical protein